ncbi:RNA polymerase sigma factor [Dyadobacter sp. NIV53]|uniref:RNA polymerase sigma factor n=1 Tax=Dyadobacter sp. NIV53 TaxID=2861765 RepID=UPI001C86EAF8|nr:sigma-70 family RNA polymerase sigma factor [Dyadobacter sp. NIV53]
MSLKYTNFSDEEILQFISMNGDKQAFEELYLRYSDMLFNYVYARVADRFIAQEIVQELFLNLWQRRNDLSVSICKSYLFSAAKNLIISNYRKELARQRQNTRWESERERENNFTYQHALVVDLQARYQEGLESLPPKCQQVFTLSRQGFSNREVAVQLEISEKTVEQHITKALRVLKVYLKEHLVYGILLLGFI